MMPATCGFASIPVGTMECPRLKANDREGDDEIISQSVSTPALILVTPDDGVRKEVINQGQGEPVPLHARCLVHYIGRLADTGETFIDTRTESTSGDPVQIVAGRDSTLQQTGLYLGVATMLRGERSRLYVKPAYGFGEKGSFSFPAVPPESQLIYDVELHDYEKVDEAKAQTSMMYEERLEAAERRRLDGNALFAADNPHDALLKYSMGLSHLNEDFLMQLEGMHLVKANAVRLPVLLNMAACHLRLQDWNTAVSCCTQVLIMDKSNAKALFRRGRARHELQQTEEAEADLQAAAQLAPGDKAIHAQLQAVKQSQHADRQAQSKMFRGWLKPDPEPVTMPDVHSSHFAWAWMVQPFSALARYIQRFASSLRSWVLRQG